MTVNHFYIPSPGQSDAAARAAALNATLAPAWMANEPRYASRITTVPCVVCDHGDDIVVIPEPTTLAAVDAAHDTMLEEHIPTTVAHTAGQVTATTAAIAAHAAAADPHPAYLTQAEGDALYSVIPHTHGIPTAGVMRVTTPQTMTATAQTAVTGMSFAAAANATYYFMMSLRISTSTGTAPTTAWGVTGPASPTSVAITIEQDTSTSVEAKTALAAFGAAAAGAQVASTGTEVRGVVQTTAAGTVQLTAARGGTTPSMVVAAGSNGFWMRVA